MTVMIVIPNILTVDFQLNESLLLKAALVFSVIVYLRILYTILSSTQAMLKVHRDSVVYSGEQCNHLHVINMMA